MSCGPALLETVRVRDRRAPLWGRHVARLERSCAALAIPVPHLHEPAGGEDRIVRFLVSRGGASSSERAVPPARAFRVVAASVPHPGYPHKTAARGAFDRALADATGADDVLLSTHEGWVGEGALTTVLWWEGDRVAAPPLELGILPSVARARIAEIAGPIVERRLPARELADRAPFLANAARGVIEVASWQGERLAADARTEALRAAFWP